MEKVLPKGWIKLNFTELLDIKGGNQPPKSQFKNEPQEGYVRLLQIRDFGDKPVPTYVPIKQNQLECNENDVLIARYGASIGRIVTGMKGTYNVALAKVISPDILPKNFIKWYLKSDIFQRPITSTQRTAQNGFNKEDLDSVIFPLPPLAEQERIVAKLDKLFAQHEKIKAALDRIPQLLKNFRQQVLTHAVTGKLTEQWRDGKDLEEWKKYTIREISDTRLGKMLDKAKNSGSEYPYLGNIDVQWNEINTDNLKRIRIDDAEFEKFKLAKGDVLVCEGGEAGRAAIWQKEDSNIIFQKALHRVQLYPKFLPEILLYNLELDTKSGRIAELYTGTTIKHLTGQNFAKYVVKYCSVTEQKQIVNRVENLFTKADTIEARYQILKIKIDSLPQAILHKAFKGELVPQLPTDGDAKDLLAEIMALKKDVKGRKRKE